MGNKTNYITQLMNQAITIRKALADLILGLPDNPNIKRMGSNAFVIDSSVLRDDFRLAPEYHDFKHQYKAIANALLSIPIEDTERWLNAICDRKHFYTGPTKVQLHPNVIENLKGIIHG